MVGILLDTGPLVAYLSEHDRYHEWAVETLEGVDPPIVTCEAVLTEACFLVARTRRPAARALEPFERGRLKIDFRLDQELGAVRALMQRYVNVPMSLADACLVRLAEITSLPICTLDGDFAIYRAHGRRPLNLISLDLRPGLHEP
jgi:predicted nucleic acid-binding protein